MSKPVKKTEQDLRETAILNAVRAQVEEVVKDYRVRMLNALPEIIDSYRDEVKLRGVLPAIDEDYRTMLRERMSKHSKKLGSGS